MYMHMCYLHPERRLIIDALKYIIKLYAAGSV